MAGTYVQAIYPYEANHSDELTFKQDDVILIKREVNADWYEGELNGIVGIFPKNFAKPCPAPKKRTPCATAIYPFEASQGDDLPFSEGQVIELIGKVNDEWLRGRANGREGIFPAAFVNIDVPLPASGAVAAPSPGSSALPKPKPKQKQPSKALTTPLTDDQPRAQAVYDYDSETPEDLTFSANDIIYLTRKVNDEWLEGYRRDDPAKKKGIFPVTFVKVVEPISETAPKPAPSKPSPASKAAKPKPPPPKAGTSPSARSSTSSSSSMNSPARAVPPPKKKPPPPSRDKSPASSTRSSASASSVPHRPPPSRPAARKPPPPSSSSASAGNRPTRPAPGLASGNSSAPPSRGPPTGDKPQKPSRKPSMSQPRPAAKPKPRPRGQSPATDKPKPPPPSRPRERAASTVKKIRFSPPPPQDPKPSTSNAPAPKPRARPRPKKRSEEMTIEKRISRVRRQLDDALDKELGLETLLSVLQESPDFDEAQQEELLENLETCRNDIEAYECQLEDLYREKGVDMTAEVEAEKNAMDVEETEALKHAVHELTTTLEEVRGELSHIQKQHQGALKLRNLALLDKESGRVDMDELETEVARTQQLLTSKELYISGLEAEREELINQIPPECMDSELKRQYDLVQEATAVHEKQQERAEKRIKVVNELVQTEEELFNDLKLCHQGYLEGEASLAKHPSLVNVQALFSNFDEVIVTSENLYRKLLAESRLSPDEQSVGMLFCQMSEELREVYVTYCCNFDEANELLASYMANPRLKALFDASQETIRAFTNTWDLGSFLIKPVQRILKYPLLLRELISTTEKTHPDHDMLVLASKKMAAVATAINEAKRRKELVEKYTTEKSKVRFDKMNWHSTMKKTKRLNQRLKEAVSFNRSAGKAEYAEFQRQEHRLAHLDQAAKKIRTRAKEFLTSISDSVGTQQAAALALQSIYSDNPSLVPQRVKDWVTIVNRLQGTVEQMKSGVEHRIMEPLRRLQATFRNPQKLIEKRADKKLDFDSYKRQHQKAKDPEKQRSIQKSLEEAEHNFRALDAQLMEELPTFCDLGRSVVAKAVMALLHLEFRYSKLVRDNLGGLVKSIPASIEEECESEVRRVMMNLLQLNIMPRGIAKEFGLSAPMTRMKHSQPASSTSSLSRASGSVSPTPSLSPSMTSRASAGDRSMARSPLSIQPLARAVVQFDFDATNADELEVEAGDEVDVLEQSDEHGNPEWWLCRRYDGAQGYVASNFLEMTEGMSRSASLASRDSGSSPHSISPAPSVASEQSVLARVRVAWDFEAESDIELSCNAGDLVDVLSWTDPDGNDDWVLVRLEGHEGYVASSFLETESDS